ncbi:hypothetical protein AB0F88_23015 [Streptosporangium sp. NPDC023963]|uniref:hypothetical protein n=1 Tax=Streptosporangium sp. NPDC023963 TaxID=3155608 RepID=UPI003419D9C4
MTFEGEESDDVRSVVQHRHPDAFLERANGDGELRGQEGVVEGRVGTLKGSPSVDFGRAEVTGLND